MSLFERRAALLFFSTALVLFGVQSYNGYVSKTVFAPTVGGSYKEAEVGEIRYINPVLAQTDAEKSVSRLIFSSLIRLDGDKIIPDAAERWETSDGGKKYTFFLRKDILFSDGKPLTAQDVVTTVNLIKTPELKSPLLKTWNEVAVSANGDYEVSFTLPKSYGPFIFNCNFGIIPAHLSDVDFSKKLTGSGIYQFVKSKNTGKIIKEVDLKRNPFYYQSPALVEKLTFNFYPTADEAKKAFEKNKRFDALSNAFSQDGKNYSFPTSKRLALILNVRNDKLKDKAVRQVILEGGKLDQKLQLNLFVPDNQLQRSKAEEIKRNLIDRNIDVTINALNPVKLQDILDSKSYELLLYGFDPGYDRDPYLFWHSSQLENMNFAGWSDKKTDIMLEDARLIEDKTERNKKYDEFFERIKSEDLIYFYDPIEYNFILRDRIKSFAPITGIEASSRYFNISSWFVNEKRVKKT